MGKVIEFKKPEGHGAEAFEEEMFDQLIAGGYSEEVASRAISSVRPLTQRATDLFSGNYSFSVEGDHEPEVVAQFQEGFDHVYKKIRDQQFRLNFEMLTILVVFKAKAEQPEV